MVDWRFRWWVGSFCLVVVGLFSAWSVEVEGSRLAQVDQDLSRAEYAVRLGSCLESRGAEWVLSGDGEAVMVLETPAQPQDVQQELIDGCRHDLIKQGLLPGPRAITPALLWEAFDNASSVRDCLRELGHPVPGWPGRHAFIDGDAPLPNVFAGVPEDKMSAAIYDCGDAYR
jgi:hypothetical protein